jgi:hypothetical protein
MLTQHTDLVVEVPRRSERRANEGITVVVDALQPEDVDARGGLAIALAVVRASIDDLGSAATRPAARRFLLVDFYNSVWEAWLASIGITIRTEVMARVVAYHSRRRTRRRIGFRSLPIRRPDVADD